MRIAVDARHVADHFPGIGRYVYSLTEALAQLGQPHTLLVLCGALPNARFDMARLARAGSLELVPCGARPFTLAEQLRIPRLLRELRADVYHAPYYVMPYAGLPCPAVVTLYDAIPQLFPAQVSPRARLLFGLLTRLAARTARGVLTISESARRDLAAAYGIDPARMAVTPLAAGGRFRPPQADEVAAARMRHGLPERYVLSLSSNKAHKNIAALTAAWELLARPGAAEAVGGAGGLPSLVLAGHGDAHGLRLSELVARHGLGGRVLLLPDVAEADLPALYGGAELFVFPSRYEGFGLPPLEAMACGAPVVCGAVSSLPEVVGDAALLVDVSRPADIAAGVARALADSGLRERLRAAGLRQAARFSWRRTAELTLAAYERAAGRYP